MVFSIQLVPISELEKYIPCIVTEKKQEVGSLSDSQPLLEWLDAPASWWIFKPRIFKVAYYINVTQEHFFLLFHKNKTHHLQSDQGALHFRDDLPILRKDPIKLLSPSPPGVIVEGEAVNTTSLCHYTNVW